ncbi:hypothetical protein SO802_023181 [Lithocarpus litseifolius]|uniref:CDT1 Geminin-binding domain-containing protein n=1 Tax=Lithocarpus litseifolius TaxID=425828 RepID=A0AAW2C710_9ROSI
MIVSQKVMALAAMNYQPPTQKMVLDVNYHHLCVASSADVAQPSSSSSPSFRDVHRVSDSMSADISRFEPVMSCSDTVNDAAIDWDFNRLHNRGVTLSVNEVRKVAKTLHPNSSARRQIQSRGPTSPEIPKPHKSKKLLPQPTKLPEKYEILAQFFDSLDSSIRLLRLKGSSSSFTNICPKIECLTDRRFTHRHLAQLKFILRDAIEIKRVLVFDERTSCMEPDLHVSINVDAVENDGKLKSESGNMHLRKVLRSRLADFSKSCPEVDEIPEELLPEPFNRKS